MLKHSMNQKNKLSKCLMIILELYLKLNKTKYGDGLKIFTPK